MGTISSRIGNCIARVGRPPNNAVNGSGCPLPVYQFLFVDSEQSGSWLVVTDNATTDAGGTASNTASVPCRESESVSTVQPAPGSCDQQGLPLSPGSGTATACTATLQSSTDHGGPQILRQPKDTSCAMQDMVVFSVHSSGTPPFRFVWQLHPAPRLRQEFGEIAAKIMQRHSVDLKCIINPDELSLHLFSKELISSDTHEKLTLPSTHSDKVCILLQSVYRHIIIHPHLFVELCDILERDGPVDTSGIMRVEFERATEEEDKLWVDVVEDGTRIQGASSSHLTIVRALESDTGSLRCRVTDAGGKIVLSRITNLTVQPPRRSSHSLPMRQMRSTLETVIESPPLFPHNMAVALSPSEPPAPCGNKQPPTQWESDVVKDIHVAAEQGLTCLKRRVAEYRSGDQAIQCEVILALLNLKREVPEVIEAALDWGFPTNVPRGQSLLHLCCERSHGQTLAALLRRRELDITSQDGNRDTPLHCACRFASPEVVMMILQQGSDLGLYTENKKKHMPLHVACIREDVNIVRLLLRCDPNHVAIQCADEEGNTPLHLACLNGNFPLVDLLLRTNQCQLDVLNEDHNLPLHIAVAKDNVQIVVKLLDKKYLKCPETVNQSNRAGNTPLHVACHSGDGGRNTLEIVKLLRRKGAGINLRNAMKHTPVDIAVAKGYDNLVHALGGRSTSLQRLNSTEHLFHLIRNHPANQSI